MLLMAERIGEQRTVKYATVIEHIGGYYETQKCHSEWSTSGIPGYLLIECGCGERLALTCFASICSKCGADHEAVVQEELAGQCSEDQALHPWRYAGEREEFGLPC